MREDAGPCLGPSATAWVVIAMSCSLYAAALREIVVAYEELHGPADVSLVLLRGGLASRTDVSDKHRLLWASTGRVPHVESILDVRFVNPSPVFWVCGPLARSEEARRAAHPGIPDW